MARDFVMSIDVDGWPSLLRFYSIDHDLAEAERQVGVEQGIERLLGVLEKHEVKATFFVTGEMAQRHHGKIKEIAQKNHEVACHGLYHGRSECLLSKSRQKYQIQEAMDIIENATGTRPAGFRAPCLRANKTTLEILNEIGCMYDSSFLPVVMPGYYGSLSLRFRPYWIIWQGHRLLEIPISSNPFFLLPISASWFRNLGLSWAELGVRTLFGLNCPVMFYIHPRDVLPLPSISGVPWHVYRKAGDKCLEMLDQLLTYVRDLGCQTLRAIDLVSKMKNLSNEMDTKKAFY